MKDSRCDEHSRTISEHKLNDLEEDVLRLCKAVNTLVIGYCPSTYGMKRYEAEAYAKKLLHELTSETKAMFKRDRTSIFKQIAAKANAVIDKR